MDLQAGMLQGTLHGDKTKPLGNSVQNDYEEDEEANTTTDLSAFSGRYSDGAFPPKQKRRRSIRRLHHLRRNLLRFGGESVITKLLVWMLLPIEHLNSLLYQRI